jgi:hypothetical protein
LKTRLQDRNPILDRIDRYTDIPGKLAQVQDLRAARRQGAQEGVEQGQVADISQVTHIPFEIGLDITGLP